MSQPIRGHLVFPIWPEKHKLLQAKLLIVSVPWTNCVLCVNHCSAGQLRGLGCLRPGRGYIQIWPVFVQQEVPQSPDARLS